MSTRSDEIGEAGGLVTRIEAKGYRSLRYVSRTLGPFHVLIGPNASGKSTFLDVVAFLGDVLRAGVQVAVQGDARQEIPLRAPDGKHLTWMRQGERIELAIEVRIPPARRALLKNGGAELCRYEMAVDVSGPLRIAAETLWLRPERPAQSPAVRQRTLFPEPEVPPDNLVYPPRKHTPTGWKKVVSRGEESERVTFNSETSGWNNPFRLGADKPALASLPEDEERFPVATWFRQMLGEGVRRLALSSDAMRRPSPPGESQAYLPDGSNLPRVVHALEQDHPQMFGRWVEHVREALPDISRITTREREEDRHRYLVLQYANGLEAPSWLVSDGTLRLLALTLLAYLPDLAGCYLIEEPENGIHPKAVETVVQSLASVYRAQVLLATHSPVVASMVDLKQILCFATTREGGTDVVPGHEHPGLRQWRGSLEPGILFASGVLS